MCAQDNALIVVGAGLAGCEAAWQAAQAGLNVILYEMKPRRFSPAHESADLAELVCSNSLRASRVDSAVGLLKEEMRLLGSLVMQAADATALPAGAALAVDRSHFAAYITEKISTHPLIQVCREEVQHIPAGTFTSPVIIAAGPLATEALTAELASITGAQHLSFYDAIAPILDAESLDMNIIYRKSRWDDEGPGDYLNCPLTKEQYEAFVGELLAAEHAPLHSFEEAKYFEGCLPIEVMAARGMNTLRFGPMKPIGLAHPQTGERFYAVVQLRAENEARTAYNMVGFQTKLTYGEQKRLFRSVPGLDQANFLRLGSMHRNTFVCAPAVLKEDLSLQNAPHIMLAGQISGVEGYVESAATGILAGIHATKRMLGLEFSAPPRESACAAMMRHLLESEPTHFQPSNINFGLFAPVPGRVPKKERGQIRAQAALAAITHWKEYLGIG